MFRAALEKAGKFTLPVVMSRRTVSGHCSSSIGAAVVLNKDGWLVTAGHILRQWHTATTDVERIKKLQDQRAAVENDASLGRKEKAARLANLVIGKDETDRCSVWWGRDGVVLRDFKYIKLDLPRFGDAVDIGVGRLDPFDPKMVQGEYPVFKNPKKAFEPGASLCKLGFPLNEVTPTWNEAQQGFVLPPGTTPLPRFPIEGIFTRTAEIVIEGGPDLGFPIRYVETSSPGLRGQSGGPTVDVEGRVWAIQAKTTHQELGFSGQNSFLNLGLGVHPDTMFGFFDKAKVAYQVSDD